MSEKIRIDVPNVPKFNPVAPYSTAIKLVYFYQHIDDVAKLAGVREEFLSEPFPAVTGVEIARLADKKLLVEIDAIAWKP